MRIFLAVLYSYSANVQHGARIPSRGTHVYLYHGKLEVIILSPKKTSRCAFVRTTRCSFFNGYSSLFGCSRDNAKNRSNFSSISMVIVLLRVLFEMNLLFEK